MPPLTPQPSETGSLSVGTFALYGTSDGGTTWYPVAVDSDGRLAIVSGLVPEEYDYIALTYTGDNLTGVVYKSGGSGGTAVATLTLSYTGSVLDSIART